MGSSAAGRHVVMSVHPHFAEAIMDGRKKVEFRKRRFADDVKVVWVYATAPVSKVIGYFEVGTIHTAKPSDLWRRFADVGCIDRAAFDRYYADRSTGEGIGIRKAVRLPRPAPIADLLPSGVPPQSYAYVAAPARSRRTRVKEYL
jgi:predicted transcriptional regulator